MKIDCALCGRQFPHRRYWYHFAEVKPGVFERVCEVADRCTPVARVIPPAPPVLDVAPEVPSPQLTLL